MRSRRLRNLSLRWVVGALACGGSACDTGTAAPGGVHGALGGYPGPQFPGAGSSAAGNALAAGTPVVSCGLPSSLPAGISGPAPSSLGTETCFYTADDPVTPAATVEWIVESAKVGDLVHVRLTLNPSFVDNTYGDNAIGWPARMMPGMPGKAPMAGPMGGNAPAPMAATMAAHTFKDLVESDHAEFKLSDARGALVLEFDADYISVDAAAPSGYGTLGVLGGEGKMIVGSAADIAAVSTSLDRDLNVCGLGSYLDSSPATDSNYTPNLAAPSWDYRVVYDVWAQKSAFGSAGFGTAIVDFVHASPSKASKDTLVVQPGPCPPTWIPYCTEPSGCCVEIDSPACSPIIPKPVVPSCTTDCPIGI